MNKYVLVVLVVTLISACGRKQETPSPFEAGVGVGELSDKQINEASGLVQSLNNPGRFWTHNDSGDQPRLFLIDSTGTWQATVHLKHAINRDWEEVATGPGPVAGVNYLYAGDIGDNDAVYPSKKIYRVPEPVIPVGVRDTTVTEGDSIEFVMDDGKRDTEAFLVDPATKDIYVFSKREKKISLYVLKYPQQTSGIDTARFVLQMQHRQVTAADITPDGNEVLVKTYDSIFYWHKEGAETTAQMLARKPVVLPYVPEPQGEAIAFDHYGLGYYTVSEVAKGERAVLYFYKRVKP